MAGHARYVYPKPVLLNDIKYMFLNYILCITLMVVPSLVGADVTVFAAASLRNAMEDAASAWSAQHRGKVTVSYAGSSALARQIERGAPADIFISADLAWMDYLEQRGLINRSMRTNLLRNSLVLIAPANANLHVKLDRELRLDRLLGNGRLAMADPAHVPAGKYGRAALEVLGLWRQVEYKLVRGENVRTALNFVARGETPLGIVYRTDATAESRVRVIAVFRTDTHPPIIYPAALLSTSKAADAAAFLVFLKSDTAAGFFRKHGFLTY